MSQSNIEKLKEIIDRIVAPKVLVVEDDAEDAFLTTKVLEDAGLTAYVAPTAADALQATASKCFCLCLLDLKLPDVADPLELIQDMKKIRPTMEIVVLTGTLHSENLRAALEKRVLAVLLKPIKPEQLKGVHI